MPPRRPISLSVDFEGGSIGRVEHRSPTHLRCAVAGQADHDNRNRQASWYFFRLHELPVGSEIRIDLVDLVGEYNHRPGAHAVTAGTRPVHSLDGKTWTHFDDAQVTWNDDAKELSLTFKAESESLWIAHVPPYTGRDLQALHSDIRHHPAFSSTSIGKTVGNRDIPLWTITDPTTPDREKRVVWIMARQHAWEAGTNWVLEGLVRRLLDDSATSTDIRKRFVFKLLPLGDPDGVASGAVRFNANGYDLNRHWDAVDRDQMPEVAAQRAAILDWLDAKHPIDLFLTIHNTESADYLEGPTSDLATRLHAALSKSDTFDSPEGPRPIKQDQLVNGRLTVYQYLATSRHIPAFLMELRVERAPKLGRCPTTDDRLAFGRELLDAVTTALASIP